MLNTSDFLVINGLENINQIIKKLTQPQRNALINASPRFGCAADHETLTSLWNAKLINNSGFLTESGLYARKVLLVQEPDFSRNPRTSPETTIDISNQSFSGHKLPQGEDKGLSLASLWTKYQRNFPYDGLLLEIQSFVAPKPHWTKDTSSMVTEFEANIVWKLLSEERARVTAEMLPNPGVSKTRGYGGWATNCKIDFNSMPSKRTIAASHCERRRGNDDLKDWAWAGYRWLERKSFQDIEACHHFPTGWVSESASTIVFAGNTSWASVIQAIIDYDIENICSVSYAKRDVQEFFYYEDTSHPLLRTLTTSSHIRKYIRKVHEDYYQSMMHSMRDMRSM